MLLTNNSPYWLLFLIVYRLESPKHGKKETMLTWYSYDIFRISLQLGILMNPHIDNLGFHRAQLKKEKKYYKDKTWQHKRIRNKRITWIINPHRHNATNCFNIQLIELSHKPHEIANSLNWNWLTEFSLV